MATLSAELRALGEAAPAPGSARAWLHALRSRTLTASVGPVLVGLALAVRQGTFEPLLAGATLACALLLQVAVNLANDYFDFVKGVDTPERVGPPRVTGALLAPARVRGAALAALGGAALLGLALVLAGGLPILALGFAALLAALAYSGGPRPLGHLGLGDALVFAFFGPLAVAGTFYLQARAWPLEAWLAGIAPGALSAAILVVNNVRDIATDARAGKRTLAVRLGPRASWAEYGALLALAYASLPPLALAGAGAGALVPSATLPLAALLLRAGRRSPGGAGLNALLARSAALHALFAVLLAGGLLL